MSERARIIVGNCLDVLPTLAPESVALVLADPPYGAASAAKVAVRGCERRIETFSEAWDQEREWTWLALAVRLLAPGGALVTFTDGIAIGEAWAACQAAGLRPASLLYWTRHDPPPNPRKTFCSACDVAVYAVKPGAPKFWAGGATTANVIHCSPSKGADRWNYPHPTQKPLELYRTIVRLLCPPGGVVLDPHAGSGTCGAAVLREGEGRTAVLVEKRADFAEMIGRRMAAEETRAPQPGLFSAAGCAP